MKKGRWLFIFIVIFLLLCISIYFIFFKNEIANLCNDGTLYNQCSKIKPYFCLNGTLIERASICGCSNISEINENKCVSKYQTNPKTISLSYVLRGEKGEINFTVYEGLYNYLSELPRYIDSDENSTLVNFKLRSLNEEQQREMLLPLLVKIENIAQDKDDQARIAVSVVQNIPFGSSNKTSYIGNFEIEYYRYPYEVLYDFRGVCGEKSELLAFLLREMGYGSAFLYYSAENHEAIGIKCPIKKSFNNTGYCFIETTGPSIITDSKTEYIPIRRLTSSPEIIPIHGSLSFGERNFYEYDDAKILDKIRERVKEYGTINYIQHLQFQNLKEKYGLINFDEYIF